MSASTSTSTSPSRLYYEFKGKYVSVLRAKDYEVGSFSQFKLLPISVDTPLAGSP